MNVFFTADSLKINIIIRNRGITMKKVFKPLIRMPALLLSAALVCTPAFALSPAVDFGITANAADETENLSNCFTYDENSDGTITITGYHPQNYVSYYDIDIPSKIDNKTVVGISQMAFWENGYLRSITLPDTITKIEPYTFFECTNLEHVSIPDSVKVIGDRAFYGCTSLKDLVIPDSTAIEGGAFLACNGLADDKGFIIIRDELCDYIGNEKEVVIPDGIKVVGEYAFSDDNNITSVIIPDGVTAIMSSALRYCPNLRYVKIPDGVTSIGRDAFFGSQNLKSLTIPDSVTDIADESIGYYYSRENGLGKLKVDNFTIYGIKDSAANKYADKNGFKFVPIYKSALTNNSTVSTAKTTVNTAVTLYGKASGGTEQFQYEYSYKKSADSEWTKISGYSSAGSATFKPDTADTYLAKVDVKDSDGKIVSKEFSVYVKNELINNSTISRNSMMTNESAVLTAAAEGGKPAYTYAYYYKKSSGSKWTTVKDYSTSSSVSLNIPTSGTYTAKVSVKDSDGDITDKEFSITVAPIPELKNLSSVSTSFITKGTDVYLTGEAEGGIAPYTYAYYYKKAADSSWTKIVSINGSAYSTLTSVSFTPDSSCEYNVRINVKDSLGSRIIKEFTLKEKQPLHNNSTISANTVNLGTAVTLSGSASDGDAPYQYAYYYKKSTESTWTKIVSVNNSAYSALTSVSFTPASSGTYDIRINVKDSTDQKVIKNFTLNVKSDLKNTSTISTANGTVNTTITLSGKASGGNSPYMYAYYYKKSTDPKWTKIVNMNGSAYSSLTEVPFTPDSAGTYNIRINAKDSVGTVVNKDFTLKVNCF